MTKKAGAIIQIACVNLTFYQVVAAVVARLLERRGYDVLVTSASHENIYPKLSTGEFHLFTAAWLPSAHLRLWRDFGRDLERWAPLYDGARSFLAVGATALPFIECIGDLGRYADRVEPVIRCLTPRAGITQLTRGALKAYRLDEVGIHVATGNPAFWREALDRALADEPVVVPLWTPLFTDALPLRPLADPLRAFGTPDTAFLVAHRSAHDLLDAGTVTMLRGLRIGRDQVSALDRQVTLDGVSLLSAARAFADTVH